MASYVNNLDTIEKCDKALEAAKTNFELGLTKESDYNSKVAQIEKRKVSLQAKPAEKIPEDFQDLEIQYLPPRGNTPGRSFRATLKDGRNGKFLSLSLAANVKYGSAYTEPQFLDLYIERLLDIRDGLNKAGIKTDAKPNV